MKLILLMSNCERISIHYKTILRETNTVNQETEVTQRTERVPVMQRVLENPFLLLFIGVVVPTVFYVVWGIMELVSIPLAN